VPDTVTANGEGFVELGSAIREVLFYRVPVETLAPSQIASDISDDAGDLEEPATPSEAPKH